MTEEQLKPCPFCGEEAVIADIMLGCPECLVTFSFGISNTEQLKAAINKWNARHGG
mgnify:CR=1 FL=1|jgi:hypothetical protein|tara:strand:+ start:18 stop:185 length:168 start_codon:yes stop_codon:yes gene_type:complete